MSSNSLTLHLASWLWGDEAESRFLSTAFCPLPPIHTHGRPCRTHMTVYRCARGRHTFEPENLQVNEGTITLPDLKTHKEVIEIKTASYSQK